MKASAVWAWSIPLLAAGCLALLLGLQANQPVFVWLNALGRGLPDELWSNLTLCGDALTILAVLLPFTWRYRLWVWAALLASVLAALWTHIPKNLWPMPRPAGVLPVEAIHIIGPVLKTGSFPSGHSTAIFTFAGLLVLGMLQQWPARFAVIVFAMLVAVSRIMVGAHWPQDILAGALGGWLCAWLGLKWSAVWHWSERPVARWGQHGFLLACALALLFHHSGYPAVMLLQSALAVASLSLWLYYGWQQRAGHGGPA